MSKVISKPISDMPSVATTIWLYVTGFILAVGLTILAYLMVTDYWLVGNTLIFSAMGLALVQLVVQLVFFLHLGRESKPRWNLSIFFFTILVLLVIVGGSLWIMYNLNYNMNMTPEQMDTYMIKQSDKGF
jgi:cytochrome o ubiquinol oxidase operon protein cyoD